MAFQDSNVEFLGAIFLPHCQKPWDCPEQSTEGRYLKKGRVAGQIIFRKPLENGPGVDFIKVES